MLTEWAEAEAKSLFAQIPGRGGDTKVRYTATNALGGFLKVKLSQGYETIGFTQADNGNMEISFE